MKNKISIIGNLGDISKVASDGQTVKTRIVTEELIKHFGEKEVIVFNTNGGIKNLFISPFVCLKACLNSRNMIIFPAQRGIRVFVPLLYLFSALFKKIKLHYCVIGGWLPNFIKNKPFIAHALKRFYAIYVETNTMKIDMEKLGYKNIVLMPNFKRLDVITDENIQTTFSKPYKLCTFSRVNKMKGIPDAVKAVKEINEEAGETVYTLDIYGNITHDDFDWFCNQENEFPSYISYKGVVAFDKSVEVLKDYYALLFPTHYYTEGIPGTIIDAYAAGLPVISAKWQSFFDIIDDNITGLGYEFDNYNEFKQVLENISKNPQTILKLKYQCIKKAQGYLPQNVLSALINNI